MNIYVGNLSYEATEEEIRALFEPFGAVSSVNVIKDKFTGRSKGFGFVEMASQSEAQTAITELNGKITRERPLTVNEARPKKDSGPR